MIQEIEESLQFLEKLGIETKDAQVLDDLRLIRSAPSIVVVGLINRGKSSLINQIIGQDVLPTGINPETFACTILETSDSDLFASYAKLADGTIETFSDRADFVAQVSRKKSNLRFREAHVQSNFRLPGGFALIDTPGCNDISVSYDSELSDLEQTWQNHGAMAGILISSVPPGVSGQDVKLLHSLKRKFGNRVVVVLKQTQSSLTLEDLENAAEVWLQHGVSAIIVGDDSTPSGFGWGSGRLSKLENVLSLMWEDGEKAKLEAVERLMLYFESEGKKILELPNIFYPDSKLIKDHIFEAFDRPNLVDSLRKFANEKYASDFEAPGISSRWIGNRDQMHLAIEAAIRGSRRAAQNISAILAMGYGIDSLPLGDLIAQLVNRNSSELDSIVMGYLPSSRQSELSELRRGIGSLPAHSEARIMDLMRPGFTRLLEKTLNEWEINCIANIFGSYYPEEILLRFVRIWTDQTPIDGGYQNSHAPLSADLQKMLQLASPAFLDVLTSDICSALVTIRSCLNQENFSTSEPWYGSRHSLDIPSLIWLAEGLFRSPKNEASSGTLQNLEEKWLIDVATSDHLRLEQWNQRAVRFSRRVAMFKGSLGTRNQQLAESIEFEHTEGDFGKWVSITRNLKDAVKSKKYDDALRVAHTTATYFLAILGITSLMKGSFFAASLLFCGCLSFLRNMVVGEESFLLIKPFKKGKNFRDAKFQFIRYIVISGLILIFLLSWSAIK